MDTPRSHALDRARRNAPFLSGLIERHAGDVARFLDDGAEAAIAAIAATRDSPDDDIARALRDERRRLALAIALGDLAGELTLERVTAALSDFADSALDRALDGVASRLTGLPRAQGFTIVALGKLGSRELNYSSDIDILLLYDPATVARRARDEPARAAHRLARELVETIGAKTEHGRVFRVDLRLRPTPDVTPIALSVDAALSHYESHALAWERAVFVRARVAAGDRALGARFLRAIEPFVWRRALDFGQVREIGAISERIRDHFSEGQAFGAGYDLKRGRGGIREAEFFAQTHQLIHGGRDPTLRVAATAPALAALAAADIIPPAAATTIADGYRVLRTIEHRLQMIDDRQTHSLPATPEALDAVARLHGLNDGNALLELLAPPVERIGALYDTLLETERRPRLPSVEAALHDRLGALAYADPARACRIVAGWRSGRYPALRSAAAQDALEAMLVDIVERLATAPDPDAALLGLDAILARLPSSLNLFHLLAARPRIFATLIDVLAHAPTLARDLGARGDLLDGLIDPAIALARLDRDELRDRLDRAGQADDYELALDRVRAIVGECRFATGVRLIEGGDPIDAMRDYAAIAEAATQTLAKAATLRFEAVHGKVPGSGLAIVALGRFGGRALTHASDLDLIFVFSGDFSATSDGERPLGATRYYNRLAQRIIAALSVPTATGGLYDVDTRLRPSGDQGPLCVSLDSFFAYQRDSAWTWEHMALTRARAVHGAPRDRQAIDDGIAGILDAPRDAARVTADALAMRADIARNKPPLGPFDTKLIDGGLVDLEFAVHSAQLINRTAFDPDLRGAVALLVAQGLAPPQIVAAHDLLTRLLATLRLVAPSLQEPAPASRALIARACGMADWPALVAAYADARHEVTRWSGALGLRGD